MPQYGTTALSPLIQKDKGSRLLLKAVVLLAAICTIRAARQLVSQPVGEQAQPNKHCRLLGTTGEDRNRVSSILDEAADWVGQLCGSPPVRMTRPRLSSEQLLLLQPCPMLV